MNGKIFGLAAVAAGTALTAKLLSKTLEEQEKKWEEERPKEPFCRPVREERFCETLDGETLSQWFKQYRNTPDIDCILGRVTPENMKLFALSGIPPELDTEYHVLLAAVDSRKNLPIAYCIIGFRNIELDMCALLGEDDFRVIEF